ncbi:caspase activity and apoptosis inhibitor 1-like [Saccoglossus kowalevskii]|uniref:Caspase activity and apoptosis inhibitor 1-like n=1 Tax=Saccoglossus kowalevskii TaxID=10224 RepID=A0ABM0GPK8_SACKO|nr:PREDICTED: caspase activity and apoptosis inhibitor 1-like [Saccoglossus kowalevskii]
MMPDSTQTGEKKAKKRKSGKKNEKPVKKKKLASKKTKKGSPSNEAEAILNSDNEYDSDLNPEKELKPIGGYIKNREEMLKHVFKCVGGEKLQSMLLISSRLDYTLVDWTIFWYTELQSGRLNYILNCPLAELKTLCLDQLEVMSKKRIRCVLDGQEMTSSSGTDDSSSEDEHKCKVEGEGVKKSKSEKDKDGGNVMDDSEFKSEEAVVKGESFVSCHSDSDPNDGRDDGIVDSTTDQREQLNEKDDVLEMALSLSPQHSGESDSLFNDDVDEEDRASIHGDSNQEVMDEQIVCNLKGENIDEKCPEVGAVVDLDAPSDLESIQLNVPARGDKGTHENRVTGSGVNKQPIVHSKLEILELEMRARAIRSLMKANEKRETVLKQIKLQRSQTNIL